MEESTPDDKRMDDDDDAEEDNPGDDGDTTSSTIRPIEPESIRRIVAGQAVTDLASAVKELVDNALDAGSKSINIRLFNQGLDIVEVSDDGCGVPRPSRPFLAHPSATSKIRSFQDIYDPSAGRSLGFRGEALFCLANLSEKLVVATRTTDEYTAQKMEFGHDGALVPESVTPVPRKTGTTVAVLKLLQSLPVRRADMERRIVQHRSKMMRWMQGYAIFSVGVRINLMDVVDARKEKTLLATTVNSTRLEQTISSVLGSKFLSTLMPITIDLTAALREAEERNNDSNRGSGSNNNNTSSSPQGNWNMEGYVSKASHHTTPSDSTKTAGAKTGQVFFSINGRPVELPKLSRILGDVWRATGEKKRPSCVLTLTLPNHEYDVNLSPEKRQVLLTKEDSICEAFRARLQEAWQPDGQFTHSASQPAAAQTAAAPLSSFVNSNTTGASVPPKVDNMESLLNLQASNRKRALEKHAKIPNAPTRRRNDIEEMDVDSQEEDDDDDDEESVSDDAETAAKRIYMRRFREEQNEQRKLNSSKLGDIDCQYGDDTTNDNNAAASHHQHHPNHPAVQYGEEDPSPRRIRRRGAFVHDISKAKQFERSVAVGINFEIPDGIEDPDDSENETVEVETPTKKQRVVTAKGTTETFPIQTGEMLEDKEEVAENDITKETASSRRVTLNMNNDSSVADSTSASAGITTSDGDKLLWTKTIANFNKSGGGASPESEIETLVKSSVSPEKAFPTPRVAFPESPNNSQVLKFEHFKCGTTSERVNQSPGPPEKMGHTNRQKVKHSRADDEAPKCRRKSAKSSTADHAGADGLEDDSCSVVWDSFQGTEGVITMARQERKRMLERKRKMRSERQRRIFEGEDYDEDDGTSDITEQLGKTTVTLGKGNFGEMKILGQFNLGFILATDSKSQLWIFDQHACDERVQFERLMSETVIKSQTLIAPLPIELDPSEESCVLDNMELFEKNGFKFKYDDTKPPRHRLALTALPHSGARDGRKAVNFGKEDVSALCDILGVSRYSAFDDDGINHSSGAGTGSGADGSGMYGNNAVRRYAGSQVLPDGDEADKVLVRLPKAIAMFASRACRGSVMIGTALSKADMEKVVTSLNDVNQPFQCAHGRPTMTHVTSLQPLMAKDAFRGEVELSGPTVSMSLTQPDDMEL